MSIPEETMYYGEKTIFHYQQLIGNMKSDMEYYIRQHYGKISRTELARRIGIPKYDLNMLLIQMKLGR